MPTYRKATTLAILSVAFVLIFAALGTPPSRAGRTRDSSRSVQEGDSTHTDNAPARQKPVKFSNQCTNKFDVNNSDKIYDGDATTRDFRAQVTLAPSQDNCHARLECFYENEQHHTGAGSTEGGTSTVMSCRANDQEKLLYVRLWCEGGHGGTCKGEWEPAT